MAKTIILVKGKVRYFYHVVSDRSDNILLTSQKYFSKSNAKRAAKQYAVDTHSRFIDLPKGY